MTMDINSPMKEYILDQLGCNRFPSIPDLGVKQMSLNRLSSCRNLGCRYTSVANEHMPVPSIKFFQGVGAGSSMWRKRLRSEGVPEGLCKWAITTHERLNEGT